MVDEGEIKFSAEHKNQRLRISEVGDRFPILCAWRELLRRTEMVGRCKERYGGAGFGNLSMRLNPPSSGMGRRRFLITGTQTGGVEELGLEHFCVVTQYDLASNRVHSVGQSLPSSESLTHGAIYDLTPQIRFVFHGHSPLIWNAARKRRLPTTDARVAYGTQEMAWEVQRLYRSSHLPERRVLAMAGHEDGIVAFGHTAEETGAALLAEWTRAYSF